MCCISCIFIQCTQLGPNPVNDTVINYWLFGVFIWKESKRKRIIYISSHCSLFIHLNIFRAISVSFFLCYNYWEEENVLSIRLKYISLVKYVYIDLCVPCMSINSHWLFFFKCVWLMRFYYMRCSGIIMKL